LPSHISYVSTLPDITQKLKHGIDELKQRFIFEPYFSGHYRRSSG